MALSDRQAWDFVSPSTSLLSPIHHLDRKRTQVQELTSSLLIQHSRRKDIPKAFTASLASYFSPLTIQIIKRKHLARAYRDHLTQQFSKFPIMQHTKRVHLPRAFPSYCTRLGFMLAERQQPPPTLSVRTRASVGKLSGSVHGSNARKGRHRSRPHRGDGQEFRNPHEMEFVSDSDSHMFSDDVPRDKDSDSSTFYDDIHYENDSSMFSEDVPCHNDRLYESFHSNCTASLLSRTHEYDSIRGDLWQNDPYYQEYENLENEITQQKQVLDGSTPNRIHAASTVQSLLGVVHVGTSQKTEYVTAGHGENGAATAYDGVDIKEHRSHNFLERSQYSSLDSEISLSQDPDISLSKQDEGDKDRVREVRSGENPSAQLGSLQNVESTYLESRECSGNDEVDGIGRDLIISNDEASFNSPPIPEDYGDLVTEMVESSEEQVVNVVESLPAQVSQVAEQVMMQMVDQLAEALPDSLVEHVGQVTEQVTLTAEQFVEQVTSQVVDPLSTTASQIVNLLSNDEDDEKSDDEFEAYTSLDIPEFKGSQGLNNFTVMQGRGIVSLVHDFYIFMLKRSPFEFTLGMFAAPILLSVIFTILYLPEFNGLAFDDTVREFIQNSDAHANERVSGLQLSWVTVFQVFMFSVSLSTGLQPELAPLSPYTLVVANLNALFAQLIFVFLSGAVFARLSQPSQPVKFSAVAIICPPPSNRRLRKEACYKALLTRYVLVGPQPCELVDVKVDLTYNYNTVTRSGTYFRTSQSLKLVRPEIAFLNKGMLVRHIIDETSPLYQRTQGMLEKEDAVFSLSVVGLERSSMQSVFHIQHYCVYDKDVVWDAEFEDMILISKKKRRVVDHSLLSKWRTIIPR